jgi:N-acyl homoserine lactone hydrolase
MVNLDVLTYGFALNSDQGSFGYSTNSLLTVGNTRILVDTGPGSRRGLLHKQLANIGLTPDDVDMVLLTHLHWDHCQNTDMFPNARILVNPVEYDYARNPKSQDHATVKYIADMLEKMKLELVSDGDTIIEGVKIIETPGHTKGHISVVADLGGENILIAGDALPDSATVLRKLPYNVFWDVKDAQNSVEKMIDASSTFYPGHDRPFHFSNNKIEYLGGPENIEVINSTDGGGTVSLTFTVHAERPVNINIVQK